MNMRRMVQVSLVVLMSVLMISTWAVAQQQQPQATAPEAHSGHEHGPAAAPGTPDGGHHQMMMERCKEMMAKREQAMAEMKAMDAKVDEKIAAMNAAKGDQKVAAMAAVINEMAAQRQMMREKMEAKHQGAMCPMMGGPGGMMGGHGGMMGGHGGMMGHKMDGQGKGMGCCPMMQKMDHGAPATAPAAPAPAAEAPKKP